MQLSLSLRLNLIQEVGCKPQALPLLEETEKLSDTFENLWDLLFPPVFNIETFVLRYVEVWTPLEISLTT